MPSNIVVVNGREFVIPDSWFEPVWRLLLMIERKTKQMARLRAAGR